MAKLEVEVGGNLRTAAAEVVAAWEASEVGALTSPSDKLVFVDWHTLCVVLTAERYDLLRLLHRMPGLGVSDLSIMLGRDADVTGGDIEALLRIGLIERDGTGALSTAVDEITSTIKLAA